LLVYALYFNWRKAPAWHADTPSYILYAARLVGRTHERMDLRTPAYPLYLLLFGMDLRAACISQIVLAATSILFLYLIAVRFLDSLLAFILCVVVALDFHVALFCSMLVTECLTCFAVMGMLFSHIRLLTKMSAGSAALALMFDLLLLLTKPTFGLIALFLYLAYIVLHFSYYRLSRIRVVYLLSLANVFVLLAWCSVNYVYHGFFGISIVGHVNRTLKLFQYGYLVQKGRNPDAPAVVKTAYATWREAGSPRHGWDWLVLLRTSDRLGGLGPRELAIMNKYLLRNNKFDFIIKSLRLIPGATTERGFYFGLTPSATLMPAAVSRAAEALFDRTGWLRLPAMLAAGLIGWIHRRKKPLLCICVGSCLLVILYNLFVITMFSFHDWGRLRMPVDLLLDFTVLWVAYMAAAAGYRGVLSLVRRKTVSA
jgi:hypothetical protein